MNIEQMKVIIEDLEDQLECAKKQLNELEENETLGYWKAILKEVIDIRLLLESYTKE